MCCEVSARIFPLAGVIRAFCQSAAAPPSSDVAELRVPRSGAAKAAVDFSKGGQVTVRNAPLNLLIAAAFQIRPEVLQGAPA